MLRLLLVVLLVAGAACGGSDDPPAVPANTAVGKVLEVSGVVSASRGSATRRLAANAEVFGDDVIDTGGDGSVAIELFHNGARWTLDSNQKNVKVSESVAWGLDKQAAAKLVEHATSSAGRHADHSAADTKESAVVAEAPKVEAAPAPTTGGASNDPPPPPAQVVQRRPIPPAPKPLPKPTIEQAKDTRAADKGSEPRERPDPTPRTTRGACDEVACTIDPSGACCGKFKKKTSEPRAPAEAEALAETVDPGQVRAGMVAVKERVTACAEKVPVKGTVKVKVAVGGDGRVAVVSVESTPDAALGECVAAAVKGATFPKSRTGVTFTFPFVF
jgi:outer membrane biosynthesis protein TonB